MLRILVSFVIVFMLGCEESDPGINKSQNEIAGVYFGEFVIDGIGSSSVYALISDDNNIRLMFLGLLGQATGHLNAIEDSYGGSLAVYQNHYENVFHGKSTYIQFNTNVTDNGMNGTWSDSISSGRVYLNKQSDDGQITNPAQFSANWVLNIGSSGGGIYTLTISIDSQGIITGSDTTGCTYLGNMVDLNKIGRVIPFNLSLTSCGAEDGDYQGLMAVTSTQLGDKLIMLASNSTYTVSVELNR